MLNKIWGSAYTYCLLCCLLPVASQAASVDWPLLNFPPGAIVEPMSGSLRQNGYQARFIRFSVKQPVGQVLQFFQNSWKASKPISASLEEWQVLTKKEGHFITTVEVKGELSNSTEGVAAVRFMQDIRPVSDSVPDDVPVYGSASITSALESDDAGRRAVTIQLSALATASSVHQYYLKELARRGWKTQAMVQGNKKNPMLIVFMDKPGRGGMVQTMQVGNTAHSVIHIDNGS